MNDRVLLTVVGLILTALVFFTYVRWRRNRRHKGQNPAASQTSFEDKKALMDSIDPAGNSTEGTLPAATPIAAETGDAPRRRVIGALILLGLILSSLSLFLQADLPDDMPQWAAFPFLLFGLAMIALGAVLSSRLESPSFLERILERLGRPLGVEPYQVVCLINSMVIAILATVAAGTSSLMISAKVAVIAWGLGILLAVIGSWRRDAPAAKFPAGAVSWALLVGAFAFLLRFLWVGQIPLVLTGDEGSTGLDALGFINGGVNNLFGIFGWHPFPSLYFFIESISVEFLGRTVVALRLPSALAGALTVSGLYLVARAMYGHRVAIVSAAFLAAMHYAVQFSRLAVMNIWDGLWFVVTLGALWYGWKTGRRAAWILAGVGLGLGQYFYATGRTMLAVIVVWLILATIFDRQGWKRNLSNLLPALISLIAVLLPLAHYISVNFSRYMGDVQTNSVLGAWLQQKMASTGDPAWQILLNQVRLGFGAYVDTNLQFWYQPGVPINRALPAALFMIGLVLMLIRFKDIRTWIVLTWLAAFGMTAALSESTPAAQRLVACTPAVALLVGFGLVELGRLLASAFSNRQKWVALGIGIAAVFLVADEIRFYFFEFTPQSAYMAKHDFVGRGADIADKIIHQLEGRPGQWEIAVLTDGSFGYYTIPSVQFLLPNVSGADLSHPWGSAENPTLPQGNTLFILLGDRASEEGLLREQFPGGVSGEFLAPDGSVLYVYYLYQAPSSS
jgi:4-amino-4-deoxy-L-arabinose transferase-like glycosyltransferase